MWTKTRRRQGSFARRPLFHTLIIGIALIAAGYASFSPGQGAIRAQESGLANSVLAARENLSVQVHVERPPVAARDFGSTVVPTPGAVTSTLDLVDETIVPETDRVRALGAATATPEVGASPTPTATPENLCARDAANQMYCIYTVRAGDSLSKIAGEFGLKASGALSAGELLAQSNKPDVVKSDDIKVGQQLRVPLVNGIIHTVFTTETLDGLATGYGVDAASIQNANGGRIAASGALAIGQNYLIPSPTKLPSLLSTSAPDAASLSAAAEEPEPEATATPEPTATPPPAPTQAPTVVPPTIAVATATPAASTSAPARATATPGASVTATPPSKSKAGFIWPASGPISSPFGPSHPLGIDIDFYANPNQPVVAAAAGIVKFAGGDACCSYGYYVIVDHGNGFETLYAHLSKLSVSAGQRVSQGQQLGLGGSTGYATGAHLHFEMRYQGGIVNPVLYLP